MKTSTFALSSSRLARRCAVALTSLVAIFALPACDNDTIDASAQENETNPRVEMRAESELTFDTKAIEVHPAARLPERPLSSRAFTPENIARSLLATGETLKEAARTDTRASFESQSWHAELDANGGQILSILQRELGEATPQDPRKLEALALKKIQTFGIPADEIGPVISRQSMNLDEQEGAVAAPEVDGYKTFAMRALNGVRVRGHRAVLTHGGEGTFRRVMMRWPALATKGHKLSSRLTTEQIVERATRSLTAEGVVRGNVTLRWMYLPVTSPDGGVTLELKVLAALPSSKEYGEGRAIEVAVDAI